MLGEGQLTEGHSSSTALDLVKQLSLNTYTGLNIWVETHENISHVKNVLNTQEQEGDRWGLRNM